MENEHEGAQLLRLSNVATGFYVSYSTFNGLESDGKFRSKINFAILERCRALTWTKAKIRQPHNQNQGSALAVDPTDGYRLPRVATFSSIRKHRADGKDVRIMGRSGRSRSTLTEGDSLMYPYDQPTIATTSVHPLPGIDDLTRSDGSHLPVEQFPDRGCCRPTVPAAAPSS